jgi:hypothetical protein
VPADAAALPCSRFLRTAPPAPPLPSRSRLRPLMVSIIQAMPSDSDGPDDQMIRTTYTRCRTRQLQTNVQPAAPRSRTLAHAGQHARSRSPAGDRGGGPVSCRAWSRLHSRLQAARGLRAARGSRLRHLVCPRDPPPIAGAHQGWQGTRRPGVTRVDGRARAACDGRAQSPLPLLADKAVCERCRSEPSGVQKQRRATASCRAAPDGPRPRTPNTPAE